MSLYLGTTPIANNAVSRNVGEIIQSTIPLSDAGLHLLDGALINGAGSYAKFVNYIAGLVSTYPDLFTTEANWQSSVTNYGVCGKFVYDSVNNTVRLPKITGFTEGTIDTTVLGDLVQAGLPNITGMIQRVSGGTVVGTATGAFNIIDSWDNQRIATTGTEQQIQQVGFNASSSNSIYGNSSTVQPQAIKVLYYIVIANSTKTQIEVDIDEIAADLNGKADVDFTNVNASGTSLASGWSMPSSRYIDLTLLASGSQYTAPANGCFTASFNVASALDMFRDTGGATPRFTVNYSSERRLCGSIDAKKGETVRVYWASSSPEYLRFTYAEGETNV